MQEKKEISRTGEEETGGDLYVRIAFWGPVGRKDAASLGMHKICAKGLSSNLRNTILILRLYDL